MNFIFLFESYLTYSSKLHNTIVFLIIIFLHSDYFANFLRLFETKSSFNFWETWFKLGTFKILKVNPNAA